MNEESIQIIEIRTDDGVKHICHSRVSDWLRFVDRDVDGNVLLDGERVVSVRFEDGVSIAIDGSKRMYSGHTRVEELANHFDVLQFVNKPTVHSKHSLNGPIILANGNRYWKSGIKFHRVDGPAFEGADGSKAYYFDGLLHRQDGPAVELANGTKEWFRNGLRDRLDGPAAEFASGRKAWYINGKRVKKAEFWDLAMIERSNRLKEEADQMLPPGLEEIAINNAGADLDIRFDGVGQGNLFLIDGNKNSITTLGQKDPNGLQELAVLPNKPSQEIGWALPLLSVAAAAVFGIAKSQLGKKRTEVANKTVEQAVAINE